MDSVLLDGSVAMQKVEGSRPFSRLTDKRPAQAGFSGQATSRLAASSVAVSRHWPRACTPRRNSGYTAPTSSKKDCGACSPSETRPRQRRARAMALMRTTLPDPVSIKLAERIAKSPRAHPLHPRSPPYQRPDRVREHQKRAPDKDRVRVPLSRSTHRARDAQPRRTPILTPRMRSQIWVEPVK
jgi:hypothetical protein